MDGIVFRAFSPGRWSLDWLRAWLGPHPDIAADLAHAHAEQARAGRGLLEQSARHVAERRAAGERHAAELDAAKARVQVAVRHEQGAQRALSTAYEPPQGRDGECRKVRLRDEPEATAYARWVEQSAGRPVGSLRGYPCRGVPECPRQPVTGARFWHICNTDPDRRTGRPAAVRDRAKERQHARGDGRTVGQRVDPTVLARLAGGPHRREETGRG